jgi:hypothetical protein
LIVKHSSRNPQDLFFFTKTSIVNQIKQKWFAAAKKWFVYIQECNAGFVARARFPKTPFYFAQILN